VARPSLHEPYPPPHPVRRVHARDARGRDLSAHRDGRKIIDGAAVCHGHPPINAAITEQLSKVAYIHTALFTNQAAEELAETPVGHKPGGLSHAYFCSSGSEGNEAAIKLARQYFLKMGQPQRTRIVARRQGYHGNTLGSLPASSNMMRRGPYAPLLSDAFCLVSPCFAYRWQRTDETETQYVQRLAGELEAEFQRLGPGNVAAFMAEPVVGATIGCVTAVSGYLETAFACGLAIYPMDGTVEGKHGDHICIAPPYVATPSDVYHRRTPGRRRG
jgi:adenosylmethionine-8-amino-7-oxononanoate aminotransferase